MVKQRNHLLALIPDYAANEMADEEKYRLVYKYVPKTVKSFVFAEFLNEVERDTILYSYIASPAVKQNIDKLLGRKHNRNIYLESLRRFEKSVKE